MALIGWLIPADKGLVRIFELRGAHQHVLGQVDQDGAGPPASGDIESLLQDAGEFLHVLGKIIVLRARARDPYDVSLLEGVIADQRGCHLTGEDNQGDGIHIGRGNACDGIRGSRPRGDEGDPDLPCSPAISVGRMDRRLLVTDQDLTEGGMVELIKKRKDRSSG
jgi:hypothetical protein